MARPILFETITRENYEKLNETKKATKNYRIKEESGYTIHIGGLEGGESQKVALSVSDNALVGASISDLNNYWDNHIDYTVEFSTDDGIVRGTSFGKFESGYSIGYVGAAGNSITYTLAANTADPTGAVSFSLG